jgi:hypothetical protein
MYMTCGKVKYIAWQRPTAGSTATAPGLLRTAGGVQHGSTATCPVRAENLVHVMRPGDIR